MKRRNAFTLTELLVVVSIIAVLATIAIPTLNRAVELSRRTVCQNNLNVAAKGMEQYVLCYDNWYPCLYLEKDGFSAIGARVTDPTWATKGNSCNMYAVVKLDMGTQESFICPSTEHVANPLGNPNTDDDFRHYTNLSYSMHIQRREASSAKEFRPVNKVSPPGMALMADRTPIAGNTGWAESGYGGYWYAQPETDTSEGGLDEARKNSFNHRQEGQNVAFVDTHVEWCITPKVGDNYDNIWTYYDGTEWGSTANRLSQLFRNTCSVNSSDSLLFP